MARGIRKYNILLLDDKKTWRDNFEQHHRNDYDITQAATGREYDVQLERMLAEKHPPDLILIDMYHPKYPDDEVRQEAANIKGEAAIQALDDAIQSARGPILDAWDPYGIKILERTRTLIDAKGYRNIPLVLYTQQGHIIANNDELKRVSELRGEWLIKNKANAEYESYRINEMIGIREQKKQNYRRAYRNVSWALASLLIIALLFLSYFMQKTFDVVLALGVSAALVAIQPYIAKMYGED